MCEMQQFFRFSIEKEVVRIETHCDKCIIAKFDDREIIFKNAGGVILIALDQLHALISQEKSGKIHLYHREVIENEAHIDTKIKIEDSTYLTIDRSLMTTFNEKQWIFYLTTKGTFNCLFNKLPSYKSYHLDNHLEDIRLAEGHLRFKLTLTTKYLKAHAAKLIIRNRQTKEEKIVTTQLSFSKKSDHDYSQILTAKINQLDLCQMIENRDHTTDSDRLDVYINIQYLETMVTDQNIRVKHSSEKEDNYAKEIWIKPFDDIAYGIFPSFRQNFCYFFLHTTVLSNASYQTYINFAKTDAAAKKKKICVIGEYPMKAQDNGLHLFKHINNFHQDEFECYYVISKNSKDLSHLTDYKEQLLYIKTPKHIEKLLHADIIAHTHSDGYLYPFISKALSEKIQGKKLFLQHGMISVKDLSYLYGKHAHPFDTDYFVVSSERERKIVINELGYSEKQVLLTGLSRFDLLLTKDKGFFINRIKKRITRSNLKILIMPTYRKEIRSEAAFIASDYYQGYQALINSEELSKLVHRYSLKIQFYLHTRFQAYSAHFTSDYVEVVPEEDESVQELLKSNDLMITDYSSVGLDFSLMKKRIIYYLFDQVGLEYAKNQSLESFLPGDIVHFQEDVLVEIERFIKSNQKIKRKHRKKLVNLFLFMDKKSNSRLIDEIRKMIKG